MHFASRKTISNIGGLHELVGLQKVWVLCSQGFYGMSSRLLRQTKVKLLLRHLVTAYPIKPSEYAEMVSSLKPNVWASLADEVPAYTSESRNKTSARGTSVLGAIVGGSNVDERIRCAQEVTKAKMWFWIGGFGLGDSMDERPALLNAVVDNLPKEKLRQICGLGLPEEILQGVASGIDLFDSTYIYQLTLGGFALTFPLERSKRQFSDSYMIDSSGSDNTKINLRATIYRKDASPIVDGCDCYTCKNHTRAYINHLINVHEMLAQILLEMEFDLFCQEFIHGRRDHIAMAAMC
ncbi:hypothetical protein MKW92_050119 [Papaver armeniacum]|nr:hypothetical protein MKW92_050119 [Papaver armeniacum]